MNYLIILGIIAVLLALSGYNPQEMQQEEFGCPDDLILVINGTEIKPFDCVNEGGVFWALHKIEIDPFVLIGGKWEIEL